MICGLVEASDGKVFFDGEDLIGMPLHQRARKGIGYLPQEASIFKDLSVEDNLLTLNRFATVKVSASPVGSVVVLKLPARL